MKKSLAISLLIPNILYADGIIKTNAEYAKDCINIKQKIHQLISVQQSNDCKLKLMLAENYMNNAATQLHSSNRTLAIQYLGESNLTLFNAEVSRCKKPKDIKKQNTNVSRMIAELS